MDYLKQKEVPTLLQMLADQLVRVKPAHPERYLATQLQLLVLQQRGIERVQFVTDGLPTPTIGGAASGAGAGAPASTVSGPPNSVVRVEILTCLGTHATEIQGCVSEVDSHAYTAALSSLIGVAPDDLKSIRTCLERAAPLISSDAMVAVIDALCHTVAAVQGFQQECAVSGALVPVKPLFLRLQAWQALAGAPAISAEKPSGDVARSSESELYITLAGGSTADISLASSGWHSALASRVGVCAPISREIVCDFGGQQKFVDSVKSRAFVSPTVTAEQLASHSLEHSQLYSISLSLSPQSALQEAGCLFASVGNAQDAENALVCIQATAAEKYRSWEPEADMQQLALMVVSSALRTAGFEPFIELPRISPCEKDAIPAKKKKPAKGKTGKKGKAPPGSADSADPADNLALVEIPDEVGLVQVMIGGDEGQQIQVLMKDAVHFYQKHAARFCSRLIAGESWFRECKDVLVSIGVVESNASFPGNVYELRQNSSVVPATQ